MALVTRCPNCTSVFKVTPQHLQVQEGNVRCGHCLQIFNSFSDLATLQEEIDADKPLELSIESEEAKRDTKNEALAAEVSDATKVGDQDSYTFDAIQSPRVSRVWGLINICILVILVGQAIYLYRAEFSIFLPSARPYLEQYCEILNCKISISQQTELLSIESSDMQKEAAQQGVATLIVMIRNQATLPQLFPSLELTLTDTKDKALASRIFSPGEYLEKNGHLSDAIEPDKEINVTLKIDSGDLNAAGYRLLLLYP
jgi:predicted Zn finger-like uncharacterized protein